MPKRHYALPKRVMDAVRRQYGNADDSINAWGLDYLMRLEHSYHGRYFDLDTQSKLIGKNGEWLAAQGEYLYLVSHQLSMLQIILEDDVPLWYCEEVFRLLNSEVYFVPVLKSEITEIIREGWYDHLRNIKRDSTYPDGGTHIEITTRIMRSYPQAYRRYFMIPMYPEVFRGV